MPAKYKFGVGCCCGEGCVIAANDFSSNLDNTTGTGSLVGGQLQLDSGEQQVFTPTAEDLGDPVLIHAIAETSSATATLRLMLQRVDDDEYIYGDVRRSGGAITLHIGIRSDGTDFDVPLSRTVEDTGGELDEPHLAILCLVPGDEQTPEEDTTGAFYPTFVVTAVGWTTPENVLYGGTGSALIICSGPGVPTSALQVGNFPAFVPPGSTITGVQAAFEGGHDGSSTDVNCIVTFDLAGDTAVSSPISIASGLSGYVFGGAGNLLGMSPTWQGINTPSSASVSLVFQDDDFGGAQITVTRILIRFWFTGPDREEAQVVLTFLNVSLAVSCIRNRIINASGLSGGFRAASGTWLLDDASYEYAQSDERPECDGCAACGSICEHCADDQGPSAWLIDLADIVDDTCTEAELLNSNTFLAPESWGPADYCNFRFNDGGQFSLNVCDGIGSGDENLLVRMYLAISEVGGTDIVFDLSVRLIRWTGSIFEDQFINYRGTFPLAGFDCFDEDGFELEFLAQGGATFVDASGSTATVYPDEFP